MNKITDNVAYIIKNINDIWQEKPGKKTLQKMVFLIEQKGIDLGYEYGLHFYGPYSSDLDASAIALSNDGIVEFDYSGLSHLMSVNEDHFVIEPEKLSENQIEIIKDLIQRFKGQNPSELELLTTAIYAYEHIDNKSEDETINGVKKIKGSKFSDDAIKKALKHFEYFDKIFV